MPTRLSTALGVTQFALRNKGVYDALIDFDSRLHVDPALIESSGIVEFIDAKKNIIQYFTNILRLVKSSEKPNDLFWKKALSLISTGEGLNTGLGYSEDGTKGSGIGPEIGETILTTIKSIQKAGINDPLIFELVGVFENNVGADRISDWISFILYHEICTYTERVSIELSIPVKKFKIHNHEFNLPFNSITTKYLVFLPEKILNDLPIASSWDDVAISAQYNAELRHKINTLIGESWKGAKKQQKSTLKEMFTQYPELLTELLSLYAKRGKKSYDFSLDHIGELIWDSLGFEFAGKSTLDLSNYSELNDKIVLDVVNKICVQFQNLIENNGLAEHLYDKNGSRRPERFPQLLLYAVADSYCRANDLDLSREPNSGLGALDFKFSHGLAKVTCELKYSSNGKLVEGYEKQLAAYNISERISEHNSIYLIIKVNNKNNTKIKKIEQLIDERVRMQKSSPRLIVINGIKQLSASKR